MTRHASALRALLGTLAALGSAVGAADAAVSHHVRHGHRHVAHHHGHNLYLHKGYARRGPPTGYKFGFSTYAGDPFYSDDYFDGGRCYYLHKRDFCVDPHPREWFR